MRKKGIGHVEIVLSFVIFAVAVAFVLVFFSPGDSERVLDTSLAHAFREVEKNVGVEFAVFDVKIDNEKIRDDEGINEEIDVVVLEIDGLDEELETDVITLEGNRLKSSREGDRISILSELGDRWLGIEFITVRFSEEFEDEGVRRAEHKKEYYTIASSNEGDVLSESQLLELIKRYHSDYFGLKEEFGLPNNVNFIFAVKFSEEESLQTKNHIPGNIQVLKESKRVRVLKKTQEVVFADLEVQVW